MQAKIHGVERLAEMVAEEKRQGRRVVHCHGVFDLLHPGHVRHLREAKRQGDRLVVSLTADRFVNKGPGRPAFHEGLRLEQLAALEAVDYVVLSEAPDAISLIKKLQPDVYVKGEEYCEAARDVTGKISKEKEAVESVGGRIYYTEDIVYSTSELINRFLDEDALRIAPFIACVKNHYCLEAILESVAALRRLRVLVVGDAIIDEYHYVEPLGIAGKGVHLTARLLEKEIFLGGALIIANHLASFAGQVTLLTAIGRHCPHTEFIQKQLIPSVIPHWLFFEGYPTLTKTRFVLRDGKTLTKLFETYSSNQPLLQKKECESLIAFIEKTHSHFDLIIVCDFGNGLTTPAMIQSLCQQPRFLAVNTQTNSGNRGYNVITHYERANFISLNEPELRLAAHDRTSPLETVAHSIASRLKSQMLSVTRGVNGVFIQSTGTPPLSIPALTTHSVDRMGAGDTYFALASLAAANGYCSLLTGLIGSVAAAMGIQVVGNKEAISYPALCKYLTRLMK